MNTFMLSIQKDIIVEWGNDSLALMFYGLKVPGIKEN
jgi:hypothetical protein